MDNSQKNKLDGITGGYVSNHLTQEFTERAFNLFNDSDQLVKLCNQWKNVAADKAQGHMFEQLEVIKFNYDAFKKDSDFVAKTTASMGAPHDPVDIVIKKGGETIKEVQAKSCNAASKSAFALSEAKYKEMLRLAPSEQHEKIKELLEKRIKTGTLKAEDYEQTYRNLIKTLEYGNVASPGTTYQEALDATDINVAVKIAEKTKLKSALTDMHKSGNQAGCVSAAITGVLGSTTGVYSVYRGETEFNELAPRILIDSAKSYATGYASTALSKGLTHFIREKFGESLARSLNRSNAPIAFATGVVNAGKALVSYMRGDIDSERCLNEIGHTALTSAFSFYYGAFGQIAIPIPVVGAVVGAGIGYFIGNILHQAGLVSLGDSQVVKAAKERRRAVQALCLSVIPEIQKNRHEFEIYIEKYFSDRKNIFIESLELMDESLLRWDVDAFASGLERISNQFGQSLQFKTFSEFNDFMASDEPLAF
jgi:hypothetical protein